MTKELGYASAAQDYWQAGFKGVLPIPYGEKVLTIKGISGYSGRYPSWPDVMAWSEEHPNANIALRLPNTVVGIDVDHYDGKRGGDTLARGESLWGALPPTVRSTSRVDGKSGIRLYRVDPGVELETLIQFPELGLGGIEVVQYFHRYCIVWPSMHGETGRRYQWLDADGNITSTIPRPASLPQLPQGWIEGLRRRANATITATADVNQVLQLLPSGKPSPRVADALAKAKSDLLANPGTRHDITLKHVLRLIRLGEQGESGIQQALHDLEDEFVKIMVKTGGRDAESARLEYRRMAAGQRGHDLIASTPTPPDVHELVGLAKPEAVSVEDRKLQATYQEIVREVQAAQLVPWTPPQVETPIHPMTSAEEDALLFGELMPSVPNGKAELTEQPLDDVDRFLFAEQPEEGTTESKTSWGPVDLEAVLSGDLTPEEPAYLVRSDNKPMLYRGRVNAFVGPPESAKSWMALVACVQAMAAAENVLYLDFEDTPSSIVMRFLALGVSPAVLRRHLSYAAPETPLDFDAQEDIARVLDTLSPTVIVADGVNAAMSLMGLDIHSNNDATKFHQLVLKPLTRIDSCVITVDHVTKASEGRGSYAIGAQAKKAMTDGAMIGVRAVDQFGRGRLGKIELSVLKDKPGGVRALAEKRGRDTDYLATVIMDARIEGVMKTDIYFDEKAEDDDRDKKEQKQATELNFEKTKLSTFLRDVDMEKKGVPMNEIGLYMWPTKSKDARYNGVRRVVESMTAGGYVELVRGGPGKPNLVYLKRPYGGPEDASEAPPTADEITFV